MSIHVNAEAAAIRRAVVSDIDSMIHIFEYARCRMRESGNPNQWVNGYPSKENIIADILNGNSYVIESEGVIVGVFTFIIGEEPNYATIEGDWPDNTPYGTIHRIAAAPDRNGIADIVLNFCKKTGVNIRIDTHKDNYPMLRWIKKRGFVYCGIIRVEDGSPRKAFQLNCHATLRNV